LGVDCRLQGDQAPVQVLYTADEVVQLAAQVDGHEIFERARRADIERRAHDHGLGVREDQLVGNAAQLSSGPSVEVDCVVLGVLESAQADLAQAF